MYVSMQMVFHLMRLAAGQGFHITLMEWPLQIRAQRKCTVSAGSMKTAFWCQTHMLHSSQ